MISEKQSHLILIKLYPVSRPHNLQSDDISRPVLVSSCAFLERARKCCVRSANKQLKRRLLRLALKFISTHIPMLQKLCNCITVDSLISMCNYLNLGRTLPIYALHEAIYVYVSTIVFLIRTSQ